MGGYRLAEITELAHKLHHSAGFFARRSPSCIIESVLIGQKRSSRDVVKEIPGKTAQCIVIRRTVQRARCVIPQIYVTSHAQPVASFKTARRRTGQISLRLCKQLRIDIPADRHHIPFIFTACRGDQADAVPGVCEYNTVIDVADRARHITAHHRAKDVHREFRRSGSIAAVKRCNLVCLKHC